MMPNILNFQSFSILKFSQSNMTNLNCPKRCFWFVQKNVSKSVVRYWWFSCLQHWCENYFSEKSDISENSPQDCVKVGQSYICSPSPAESRFELNWRRYIFFFFFFANVVVRNEIAKPRLTSHSLQQSKIVVTTGNKAL